MKTQERIAKAWYLKQYLSQLEKLLIEEQCHTANDSKAFKQLLDLIERDTPTKVIYDDSRLGKKGITEYSLAICPSCKQSFIFDENATEFKCCPNCGQALDWSEE